MKLRAAVLAGLVGMSLACGLGDDDHIVYTKLDGLQFAGAMVGGTLPDSARDARVVESLWTDTVVVGEVRVDRGEALVWLETADLGCDPVVTDEPPPLFRQLGDRDAWSVPQVSAWRTRRCVEEDQTVITVSVPQAGPGWLWITKTRP